MPRGLVQGAGEGTPADEVGRLGVLGEQIGERSRDLLEDLAVLVVGERSQDADIRDEKLAFVAAARAAVGNVAQAADREARQRRIALEEG